MDGVFGSYTVGISFIQVKTDDTQTVNRKTVQPGATTRPLNMPAGDGLPDGDIFTYPFALAGGTPVDIDVTALPAVDLVSKSFSNLNILFGMNTGTYPVRIGPSPTDGWFGPYSFTATVGGGGADSGFGDMPPGFMPPGFMPPGFMGPAGAGGGGTTTVPSGYEEVPPGESMIHANRVTGWPADSTHKNIRIDPGANPGTFLLVIVGQR